MLVDNYDVRLSTSAIQSSTIYYARLCEESDSYFLS